MQLTPAHLELLVCPVCRGALAFAPAAQPAIDCVQCRRRYAIVDGLPVLIAARAGPMP